MRRKRSWEIANKNVRLKPISFYRFVSISFRYPLKHIVGHRTMNDGRSTTDTTTVPHQSHKTNNSFDKFSSLHLPLCFIDSKEFPLFVENWSGVYPIEPYTLDSQLVVTKYMICCIIALLNCFFLAFGVFLSHWDALRVECAMHLYTVHSLLFCIFLWDDICVIYYWHKPST